jgi:hypothetical protein
MDLSAEAFVLFNLNDLNKVSMRNNNYLNIVQKELIKISADENKAKIQFPEFEISRVDRNCRKSEYSPRQGQIRLDFPPVEPGRIPDDYGVASIVFFRSQLVNQGYKVEYLK